MRSIASALAGQPAASHGQFQAPEPALLVRASGRARASEGPVLVQILAWLLERPVPVPSRPTVAVPSTAEASDERGTGEQANQPGHALKLRHAGCIRDGGTK